MRRRSAGARSSAATCTVEDRPRQSSSVGRGVPRNRRLKRRRFIGLRVAGVDMLERQRRSANHGGEFLARFGGDRTLYATGYRRRHHGLPGGPGRLSRRSICGSDLTVSRGYGVTEIHIPEGSEYVGQAIAESGLRDRDLNVLTLYRGTSVIPNPKSSRELEAGDRLLCFGKLELMRDLIPAKTRRKRRPKVKDLPDLPVADEVHVDENESLNTIES